MKYYIFSLVIGVIISITFNYFKYFKTKKIVIPLLFDIFLTSSITLIIIKTSIFIDSKEILFLLFVYLVIYLIYIFKFRPKIYLFYMEKKRDQAIEVLYQKNFKNKIIVYKSEKHSQISVLLNNKDVVIGNRIVSQISNEDICNVIAVNYTNNKLLYVLFLLIYFSPAVTFYYASTQENNTKIVFILFASFLIFLIRKILPKLKKKYNIKTLKGIVNKHNMINSVEKYYSVVIENSSKNKKIIHNLKKKEIIESLNKI